MPPSSASPPTSQSLVDDGDTVQFGVGSLGAAVLDALAEHQDLGFHTGMVTDGLLRLVDKGVATGSRKEIDPGLIVAGTALGSAELYNRVSDLPARFLPTSYTHSPRVLSQLQSLVSVNFAVEVDLSGQVGAEVSRGVYVGAVGGQVDFTRAAALTGKRSIIALRATSGGQSTIKAVPRRRGGHHRALRRRHRRHRIRRRAFARLQPEGTSTTTSRNRRPRVPR